MALCDVCSGYYINDNALPTFGYGAAGCALPTFGYGGVGYNYSINSIYSSVGKKLYPISRQSSGPIILKWRSCGYHIGRYYMSAIAQDAGKPQDWDTNGWNFFAEVLSSATSGQYLFRNFGASGFLVDKFGISKGLIVMCFASGVPELYDSTGRNNHTAYVWAEQPVSGYITYKVPLEYRVVY